VIPADYVADWVKELSKHSFGNIRIVRKTLVFDSDFEFNFVVYKIIGRWKMKMLPHILAA